MTGDPAEWGAGRVNGAFVGAVKREGEALTLDGFMCDVAHLSRTRIAVVTANGENAAAEGMMRGKR